MYMDDYIPTENADKLFFYSKRIEHDVEDGRWTIHVEPDECLTGYEEEVDVDQPLEELTDSTPHSRVKNSNIVYTGQIPFSAGTIILVNDSIVLLRRDESAPADPLMWTSPAGRGDARPSTTAVRELHEELLVRAEGRPGFIKPAGERDSNPQTYIKTLRRKGIHADPDDWQGIPAAVPERYQPRLETVVTEFGGTKHEDTFWVFWDERSSTLELRKVYQLKVPEEVDSLSFADGEYTRETRLFTPNDINDLDADDLVPTDRKFREIFVQTELGEAGSRPSK